MEIYVSDLKAKYSHRHQGNEGARHPKKIEEEQKEY
jgi:hypothetical protein